MDKNPITFGSKAGLHHLLIKDREEEGETDHPKKQHRQTPNIRLILFFFFFFKETDQYNACVEKNILTAFSCGPLKPNTSFAFQKEKLFPVNTFVIGEVGFYTKFYDILTSATQARATQIQAQKNLLEHLHPNANTVFRVALGKQITLLSLAITWGLCVTQAVSSATGQVIMLTILTSNQVSIQQQQEQATLYQCLSKVCSSSTGPSPLKQHQYRAESAV